MIPSTKAILDVNLPHIPKSSRLIAAELKIKRGGEVKESGCFDNGKYICETLPGGQQLSTTYIQRKLCIGYNRTLMLREELIEAGVIEVYEVFKIRVKQ